MTLTQIRLETARLVLRVPQAGDFDRFAELVGDPVAARWIGGHLPRSAAWRKFLQQPGAWVVQGFGMFSFIERGTGRWLTNTGASGTEVFAPPKGATTPLAWKAPDYTPDVRRFAEILREDLGSAVRFRPTDTEIEAITATAADAELLRAYVDQVYSQLQAGVSAAKPGQTEIMTAGPALKDLPGGYSQHVGHFRKGIEIYGFKYVEPGKTSGMAYDGLFRLGVRWFFIPKAWRAFAP